MHYTSLILLLTIIQWKIYIKIWFDFYIRKKSLLIIWVVVIYYREGIFNFYKYIIYVSGFQQ